MPLQGWSDVLPGSSGLQREHGIQRVKTKEVAVRFAGRRTRTAIAHAFEAVHSLESSVGQFVLLWSVFVQCPCLCGKVEHHPVRPDSAWRARIVDNQREAARPRWRVRPLEWR